MSESTGQQIAYGDALEPFPAWQPLNDTGIRVSGWDIRRGRTDEFTRTGTGTATIYVNDIEGLFNAGAEFPTHARILLRGSPMFRGYVDDVDVDVRPSGVASNVAIVCSDAFDLFAGIEMQDEFAFPGISSVRKWGNLPPQGTEGVFFEDGQVDDRMILVLFQSGWSTSLQSIYSGNVNVAESVYDPATSVLQALWDAADAEFPTVANLVMSAEGVLLFRGRFARFTPDAYGISRWQAGTGSNVTTGVAQTRILGYTTGKKSIYNAALCYPDPNRHPQELEMKDQIVVDETSIAKWGRRSWSAENILTLRHNANGNTGAQECALYAQYVIQNYADPVPRVTKLGFKSLRDSDPRAAATWALMQGVEIGDIVELTTDWISGSYFVEGITAKARELDGTIPLAEVELDLSPQALWTVDPF